METEGDNLSADLSREHLQAFEESRSVARRASVDHETRLWTFGIFGLAPSAVVWWTAATFGELGRLETRFLQAGAIAMGFAFLVALIKRIRYERAGLRASGHRNLTKKWLVAFNLAIIAPMHIAWATVINETAFPPYLSTLGFLAWYFTVPPVLWRKHCEVVMEPLP